jgi:hypothetical protein
MAKLSLRHFIPFHLGCTLHTNRKQINVLQKKFFKSMLYKIHNFVQKSLY